MHVLNCGMYPYSQFFLQSVDFSISLSELSLNLSTPSIHLCLQQQYDTSVQNPSLYYLCCTHLELLKLRLYCSQLLVFGSILGLHTETIKATITTEVSLYSHRFLLSVFAVLSVAYQSQHPSLGFDPVLPPHLPAAFLCPPEQPEHAVTTSPHSRIFISLLSMSVLLSVAC